MSKDKTEPETPGILLVLEPDPKPPDEVSSRNGPRTAKLTESVLEPDPEPPDYLSRNHKMI